MQIVIRGLRMSNRKGLATDSLILMFVKFITMGVNIIQAMILSRAFSKGDYGTYSQGILIISILTTMLGLGLNNAINYFFNCNKSNEEKRAYVSTIFVLTILLGLIGGVVVLLTKQYVIRYFNNLDLFNIVIYVSFRPLISNLINLYQQLYISNGMTKVIALRNLSISIIQIIITWIASYYIKSINIIFLLLLILDISQLLVFSNIFRKKCFKINILNFKIKYVKLILKYSLPLATALMMGAILKDMDKLLISRLMSKESLALYANVSRALPFEFIATSFTTIITPTIINLLSRNKISSLVEVWSKYLEIGYVTTWILCAGAVVCNKELLLFLYSEKYIDGLAIFTIYIFVEVFRFTYFGMILSAAGKTKSIFIYSVITMVLNLVLNLVLFNLMGIVGPAFASLVSIGFINIIQLIHSAKVIDMSVLKIIDINKIINLVMQILVVGTIIYTLKILFSRYVNNNLITLVIFYTMFVGTMFSLNKKNIKGLISDLNSIKYN